MDAETSGGPGRGTVEHLTLEHWFINHQLGLIRRTNFHLPGSFDVNVSRPVFKLKDENPASYFTAMTVKAVAQVMEEWPACNRIYMRTLFGPRLIRPSYIAVNVPILLRHPNGSVVTATVLQEPQRKTIQQIRSEMRDAVSGSLTRHPLARFLVDRKNVWWNRLALRLLAFFAYRTPSLFLKHRAGGISVSSLIGEGKESVPLTTVSFGPTAFTVMLTSYWRDENGWWLRLGVGFDHMAAPGQMAVAFAKRLSTVLMAESMTEVHAPRVATEINA